jgi:AraC-like DNA-binding protein
MIDRTSSSAWVRRLAEMFASQGLDAMRLLGAAGLEPRRLQDPNGRFTVDEISRLWELAVQWSGNPALGVDRELAARFIDFEVVGYAMLACADLRAALEEFVPYLAVISSATTMELQPQGEDLWLVMGHAGYSRPLPPQRTTYSLLAWFTLCRWVTRQEVVPRMVHFGFTPPADPSLWERAFGSPVRFGQADHRMLIAAADLALPLPARNPVLLALHEQASRERLLMLGNSTTSVRVTEEIMRTLRHGEPRRQDIAAALAMTGRTLQRRLQAENTSFQQLVDEARRELARKYLTDSRHALGEIALLLGFADHSNFFRACKRWFGVPPTQYRQQLLQQRVH